MFHLIMTSGQRGMKGLAQLSSWQKRGIALDD
jgi:hypothetical protein